MDIEEDLKMHHNLNDDDSDPKRLSWPVKVILSLFLLLIITMWTFSYYGGKLDPEPRNIPTKEEVVPVGITLGNTSTKIADYQELYKFITPEDQEIKRIADRVAAQSCDRDRVCQAKALFFFVRDNYDYISDPIDSEYIEYPIEFLSIGGGDCESGTIALASLLESIGIYTELVFIPKHVYLKIKLPEANNRYQKGGWVYLDWTCKGCGFGEDPNS
ncbi:MAG: transglutaminase-like domain-containing protein [Nanoarchaeota archaeon]|nr:transglutaminase-like domain-containing protein [Nanoarchaeota archaeon]MBU1704080.1 transglutaminase-like domain-containing protein [Nanoarchaeota archaeon]